MSFKCHEDVERTDLLRLIEVDANILIYSEILGKEKSHLY